MTKQEVYTLTFWPPTAALLVSTLIIFLTHPIFWFGVWSRAEPMVVGLHVVGALGAAALIVLAILDFRAFGEAITHPLVIINFLLAIWALVGATFSHHPILAIFGSPQMGQGALWFLDLAVLMACAVHVIRSELAWRVVLIGSASVILVVLIFRVTEIRPGESMFLRVNDFLAYLAFTLPFMALRHTEGHRRWLFGVCTVLGIGMLIASDNKTAWVILFGVLGIASAIWLYARLSISTRSARDHWIISRPTLTAVVGILVIAPLIVIRNGGFLAASSSVQSRHLIAQVMEVAQPVHFIPLVFGNGWGSVQTALVENITATSEVLWSSAWDVLTRDVFHSHNWLIEYLYSSGAIGVVLALAALLAFPVISPPNFRLAAAVFAATLGGLESVWFHLSFAVPFLAMTGIALTTSKSTPFSKGLGKRGCALGLAVVGVIAIGQISGAYTLLKFGLESGVAAKRVQNFSSRQVVTKFPRDFRGTEYALAITTRTYLKRLRDSGQPSKPEIATHLSQTTTVIIENLATRIPTASSSFLTLAGVSLFSEIMFVPRLAWLRPTVQQHLELWRNWVGILINQAPDRTDALSIYFSWLLTRDKVEELAEMSRNILVRRPNDAVGLYFLGACLVLDERQGIKQQGIRYLRRAFDNGIERVFPVDPTLKNQILDAVR